MVNIKVDSNDFEKKIAAFRKDMPKIGKKLMAYVFTKMRKDIRTNISANFKRKKGWLRSDINYYAFNDFSGSISSYNSRGQGAHYASVLEKGAVITAKNNYLTFKTANDQWHKVKSVVIPARPYFKPIVDDYWGSGGQKAARLMDEGLQKEINKYVEKKGGGVVIVNTEG
jgi:hypothetical protein